MDLLVAIDDCENECESEHNTSQRSFSFSHSNDGCNEFQQAFMRIIKKTRPWQRCRSDLNLLRHYWKLEYGDVFGELNNDMLEDFLQNAKVVTLKQNTLLYLQGQYLAGYYIVLTGAVKIASANSWRHPHRLKLAGYGLKGLDGDPLDLQTLPKDFKLSVLGTTVAVVEGGCGFGEIPGDKFQQTCSAMTTMTTTLLFIDLNCYNRIITAQQHLHLNVWDRINFLTNLPLLHCVPSTLLSATAFKLHSLYVRDQEILVEENGLVEDVIIIRTGSAFVVNVVMRNIASATPERREQFERVSRCQPGSMIGIFEYFSSQETYSHTIRASGNVEVMKMRLDDISELKQHFNHREFDDYMYKQSENHQLRHKYRPPEKISLTKVLSADSSHSLSKIKIAKNKAWSLQGRLFHSADMNMKDFAEIDEDLTRRKSAIISNLSKHSPTVPTLPDAFPTFQTNTTSSPRNGRRLSFESMAAAPLQMCRLGAPQHIKKSWNNISLEKLPDIVGVHDDKFLDHDYLQTQLSDSIFSARGVDKCLRERNKLNVYACKVAPSSPAIPAVIKTSRLPESHPHQSSKSLKNGSNSPKLSHMQAKSDFQLDIDSNAPKNDSRNSPSMDSTPQIIRSLCLQSRPCQVNPGYLKKSMSCALLGKSNRNLDSITAAKVPSEVTQECPPLSKLPSSCV